MSYRAFMKRAVVATVLSAAALFAPTAALAQSVITQSPDAAHEILSVTFSADTDARSHSRLTSGNRLTLLENGVVSFPVKHALIATATSQVMVTTMQWNWDTTGRAFADALIARAQAGVTVRAVVDGALADLRIVYKLRQGGVKVARYNRWIFGWWGRNGRMHEKTVVADLARATVGGMNIANGYALGNGSNDKYHDVDVLVEGPAAAESARRFLELYTSLAPSDTAAAALLASVDSWTQQPAAPAPGRDGYARVIVSEPDLSKEYILDYYIRAFDAAKTQVLWHTNNPMPIEPLLGAVKRAGARGVRVVLVTNSESAFMAKSGNFAGWWQNFWIETFYRKKLRAPGIELWEMDTPVHSKVLAVDGVMVSIGSFNFGASSIENNTEQTVVSHDPALVRAVEEMFERDLAKSRRVQ